MGITVVGLGPGDGRLLTREAWELLSNAAELYVRTARHPAVGDLPESLTVHSFDHIYDQSEKFEDVYSEIVSVLIAKAAAGPLIYAVPGNPFMGESTVLMLQKAAQAQQIGVQVVAGLSYIEPCLAAVGVDGMEGLQLHDALTVAAQDYPQVNGDHPLLIGQVFSRLMASDLKERLTLIYPDEHPAYLIHSAGMPDQQVEEIALFEIDHSESINHLTSLYIPPLPQKSDMVALAEAIATLRAPGGCPWDQKQTPQSMRVGWLEEVCVVLDAIDRDESADICEELGDVLLHVTMQAQMASEAGEFTLSDVIAGIYAKLIRRHPHVWGTTAVDGSDDVVINWEAIKAQEKSSAGKPVDDSLLTNIPVALPALA
ncbi:MAG: SAM-dependent methyltransferase, partial [Chloroflexota bacterium]